MKEVRRVQRRLNFDMGAEEERGYPQPILI